MNKPKVLITRKWPISIETKLVQRYNVTLNNDNHPMSAEECKSALQKYDAICPTVCNSLPTQVLNVANKRCKILASGFII